MNLNDGNPEYRAGLIVGIVFIIAFAAYIILLQHSKANAQVSNMILMQNSSYQQHHKTYETYETQNRAYPVYNNDSLENDMFYSMNRHVIMCRQKYNNQDLLYKFCRTSNEDFGVSCKEDMLEYATYIIKYAVQYDIDPWLFLAIAYHETKFNAYVVGKVKKERGIFQIHPGNKHAKDSKFIHNRAYRIACKTIPGHCQEEVVHIAAKIYNDAVEDCRGHTKKALSAYNQGECTPIRKSYVHTVLNHRKSLMNPDSIYVRSCSSKSNIDV